MPTRFQEPAATHSGTRSSPRPERSGRDLQDAPCQTLARGIGWFSIGLGVAEMLRPRSMARITHVRPGLIRRYGMREIACGIGILASQRPSRWVWGRVIGDGIDLISLAEALAETRAMKGSVWASFLTVAGITALDVACATSLNADEKK